MGLGIFSNPAIQAGAGRRGSYMTSRNTFIARERKRLGLTQAECSKHCGVSLRTFQRAEAGDGCSIKRRQIERSLGALW